MYRKFKPPFFWTAIAQDRQSCQSHFCLTKNPLLYRSVRPESGRVRADSSVGLRWQAVFSVPQIVWNRSTRRAGARGGARVGRSKWLILTKLSPEFLSRANQVIKDAPR